MSEQELYDRLKEYVEINTTTSPEAMLIRFKDEGGSQENAYKVCEQIRQLYSENEILEDRILDVMDQVGGWCIPDYWIWNQPLNFK